MRIATLFNTNMTNFQPTSLAVRNEVKKFLEKHTKPGDHVLLAVSGGFDSLALAHIVQSIRDELGIVVSALTIDHALQEQSHIWTDKTVQELKDFGILDATSRRVQVDIDSPDGLEAAARSVRYQALHTYADEIGATAIVVAHTLDDQAETVLLRLAQGASTQSIAAMRSIQGTVWRPLLNVRRADLRTYLRDLNIEAIDDPHNYDHRFTRVRVREELLPLLKEVLGKDVVNSLARTAQLAALDSDTLDQLTDTSYQDVVIASEVQCDRLRVELPAIQLRILYRWLREIGSPRCSHEHVQGLLRLALENNLKGPVRVPGFEIQKDSGTLRAVRSTDG